MTEMKLHAVRAPSAPGTVVSINNGSLVFSVNSQR